MKMSKEIFGELCEAIDGIMSKHSLKVITNHRQTIRFARDQFASFVWSIFRMSQFNCSKLYATGLNDSHIETALKRILSDFE